MKTRMARFIVAATASIALVAGPLLNDAAARERGGGRSGQAGFARSGPGASGGFAAPRSSRQTAARQAGATQRSGQRAATAQTESRQSGATERSQQRAETQQVRAQERSDTRTSNATERTERTEIRQGERTERTEARQAGQTERTQARTDAAESVANNWDGRGYYYDDDDDDWGYAIAGAAVGAAVGFVAGAATAQAAAPTYVTVLPCTPVVVVATGVSYYRCDTLWYNRSYVNGNVAYVVVTAPPGY